jgi:uncharacterized protein YjbI with pentapeptide repeats
MSTLVLHDKLTQSKTGAPVRAIAVALTDTATRNLDGARRGTLIRYLWQAGLIDRPHPVVGLFLMDLNRAILRDANLFKAVLSRVSLSEADVTNAELAGADLQGSYMRASNLTSADLSCFHEPGGKRRTCADLSGADLSFAFLRNTDLVSANLTRAGLTGADLTKAKLNGANLQGSYMRASNLTSADLGCFYWAGGKTRTCADLSGADLSDAFLRNTDLVGANLTDARLTGADLTKVRYNSKPIHTTDAFGHTLTMEPTIWPRGFDVSATRAICIDC